MDSQLAEVQESLREVVAKSTATDREYQELSREMVDVKAEQADTATTLAGVHNKLFTLNSEVILRLPAEHFWDREEKLEQRLLHI